MAAMSFRALFHASETAFKASRSLYRYARRVNGAKEDIKRFANGVETYSRVIGAAYFALDKHYTRCTSMQTDAPTLAYLTKYQVIKKLTAECKLVTNDIETLKPEARALRGKSAIWTCFKWGLQKKEIAELTPRMESVKLSLLVITGVLQLEANNQQPGSLNSEEEIKHLEGTIKTHLRTIEFLLDSFAVKRTSLRDRDFVALADEVQNALGSLGKRMVDHGEVPGFPQPPIVTQPRHQPQIPIAANRTKFRSSSSHSAPGPRSVPLFPSSSRRQSTASMPTQIHANRVMQSSRQRPLPSESMEELQPRQSGNIDREIAIPHDSELDLQPSHVPIRRDGDFLSVREESNHLRLNPAAYRAVSGYMKTKRGQRHTTVFIDNGFGGNLVSQAFAASLGLDVELFDNDDQSLDGPSTVCIETWIDFGDGHREKAIGKAKLVWTPVLDRSKSFPVHCWVCVQPNRELVFGSSFLEKVEHYRNTGRNIG